MSLYYIIAAAAAAAAASSNVYTAFLFKKIICIFKVCAKSQTMQS